MTEPTEAGARAPRLESWHQPIWEALRLRLDGDRMAHALLLTGLRGLGKQALAEALTQTLLCEDRVPGDTACGGCRGCTLARAGTHPDLVRIGLEDDRRMIVVDQIRELIRKASLTSSMGRYQVFLIDPADRMNVNAANALLKTLEEPRADTVMLLLGDDASRLPVTVRSRCQQYHLKAPERGEADAWLASRCDAPEPTRLRALTAASGVPACALELIESGQLAVFEELCGDLDRLRNGGDPIAVAARWVDDQPSQRLQWMATEIARRAGELAGGGLTRSAELASLVALAADVDRTRHLMDSNLRPELLIEALLARWQTGAAEPGAQLW